MSQLGPLSRYVLLHAAKQAYNTQRLVTAPMPKRCLRNKNYVFWGWTGARSRDPQNNIASLLAVYKWYTLHRLVITKQKFSCFLSKSASCARAILGPQWKAKRASQKRSFRILYEPGKPCS